MYQAGCQRGWWLGKNLPYILFFCSKRDCGSAKPFVVCESRQSGLLGGVNPIAPPLQTLG